MVERRIFSDWKYKSRHCWFRCVPTMAVLVSPTTYTLWLLSNMPPDLHLKSTQHTPPDYYKSANPAPTADTYSRHTHLPPQGCRWTPPVHPHIAALHRRYRYWICKIEISFRCPPQVLCVLLRQLAGSLPSLFTVRCRQADTKTAFFDGKGFAAVSVIVQLTAFCGIFDGKFRQSLFEVCVVGADFHKVVCFCEINAGSLLLLGKPCFHKYLLNL